MEVDARRRQLGELETRDRAQQLERMGVSTETVDYVETTPPRTAAAVAAETALLAADHAGILPPHIRWFTRARGRVDERRVVRRGSPVRGFVDRMERPSTIWLNVGQDHDDLVEAVIHEVAHLRVGDAGRSELAVHRFVDDYNNVGPGWFDRRDR